MKTPICHHPLLIVIGAVALAPVLGRGADADSAPANAAPAQAQPVLVTGTQTTTVAAPPKLPFGVEDVLKLTKAQVGEDVVVNFVQNSGTIYNLAPNDIVYLKSEGVSDRVLNTMLDQRKRAEAAAQPAPQPAPQAPLQVAPSATYADPNVPQPAPVYNQAPAPEQPAPSSVYVIPYTPTSYAAYGYYGGYYGPYGYYAPYYYRRPYYPGYYGPGIAVGFHFGGGGHYYHGGGGHYYHHH